ncbi:cytochrome P450 [Halteromyces radiatus]|uniref:cytochrome P450 n=1 Tax=Halteromyces radiatus TaxID=101107 RepID=UPI002220132F|nr:cytochrome P450 [Halteromyces radiatus]KAI8086171.1 cytochrome P450 [Halteromyces radiatus]
MDEHQLKNIVGITAGTAAAALTALAIKYNDRALFDEHNPGTPYRKGYPLLGTLPGLIRGKCTIHDFTMKAFNDANAMTISVSSLGIPHAVQTIDPANVEHILKNNFENYVKGPKFNESTKDILGHGIFNANGEQWKWQRKAASLIFNVKNFRDHFTDVFVNEMEIMCDMFNRATETNEVVDLHDMMFRFTLDSFVLLGFGVDIKSLTHGEKVPFAASFDILQQGAFEKFIDPFVNVRNTFKKYFMPWETTPEQHLEVIDAFAKNVIDGRRAQLAAGEVHKDLLSRFMNARNEFGEPLNDVELRDTIMNFIIAGRDTTAQALSWTFLCLAQHPRVEEKLVKEIMEYIDDDVEHDSPALYEKIKDMTYAHAVFYEVLRLYPSVPGNQKYALNDDVWPDGTTIRKGDYVNWSPYAQGRSEKIWGPDAKEFVPERWLTPEGDLRRETPGKWPAFHAGPRVCLGQNLATLEGLVALSFLLRRYKFTMVPGQNVTYNVSLTLPMKEGLKVLIEKRV